MDEATWLATDDVAAMLGYVTGNGWAEASSHEWDRRISDRKLRLFACACADLVSNDRTAYGEEGGRLDDPLRVALAWARPEVPIPAPLRVALLRDVVGNPWRPRPVLLREVWFWNDATVPKMARRVYDERDWAVMPVLADALEDAGCTDAAVLRHCREGEQVPHEYTTARGAIRATVYRPGPHARGCWVLDLLLGKE